ncbi:6-carboxytetrahydropterin synthase QueD, partial [Bacillus cereus]|nr:6-carboxytetrahydropterin synthase QueD [Bacillus cereus]
MDKFFGFRIVENLQKMDKDIQRKQIKYHNK